MKAMHTVGLVAAAAMMASGTAVAGDMATNFSDTLEVSGEFKIESAFKVNRGNYTGQATTVFDPDDMNDVGDVQKLQGSADFFINGDFTEDTSLHAQIKFAVDPRAVDGYQLSEPNTQFDLLRELYIDTRAGDVDLRLGKQQVVWGTADGIKLLDIVNPTDFREFVQAPFDESRIPVWMAKAEIDVGEDGNLQALIAQNEENKFAGFETGGAPGHPFIFKGVDSIFGPVNGFFSIVPEMGAVSGAFDAAADGGAFGGFPLGAVVNMTVDFFASAPDASALSPAFPAVPGSEVLAGIAYSTPPGGVAGVTNLVDNFGTSWDASTPNSTFEYMGDATFATFASFVGAGTVYERDYPDELDPNFGLRYKGVAGDNINYSLNYLWHYDPNPYITLGWRERATGEALTPGFLQWDGVNPPVFGTTPDYTAVTNTVVLARGDGTLIDPSNDIGEAADLVFTERQQRIHSIGGSFDTAFDTDTLGPLVVRGEAVYQIDTRQPTIDRMALGIGDLANGLVMEKADMFKYVLGAEFIAMTNLTISGQFIQFINLDFKDGAEVYTGDFATLHLSNGLRKGEEFKEFYSLFFSKPFGAEQQGRWNNITIYEENGGWWNRFDVEYSFTDDLIGLAAWNQYWGDDDTMFGQFGASSTFQVGLKMLF